MPTEEAMLEKEPAEIEADPNRVEKLNQIEITNMQRNLFDELIGSLQQQNDKCKHSGGNNNLLSISHNQKVMQLVSDPELLDHYKSRLSHLMFENDAFNFAVEQDEATFGILPSQYQIRIEKEQILLTKIRSIFEFN